MLQDVNFSTKHDYCSLSAIPTLRPLGTVITLLFFLNIPIVVVDVALFLVNTKQLEKAKKNSVVIYQLSGIYQLRENMISLNVTLPFVICHVCTEALYLMANALVRNFVAQTQLEFLLFAECTFLLMCLYTCLAIFLPYFFRKRRQKYIVPTALAVENTIKHFKSLNDQFDIAFRLKEKPMRSMSTLV
ncbi:hypothetical protein M3Y97_00167800 [Aphelenchoides bicaudatus]|nr:hypothetical protein M3Y97_00167800 [Aphelenchoides bicaudatus]